MNRLPTAPLRTGITNSIVADAHSRTNLVKVRPTSAVVPENIDAVHELIKNDRHVTYREIEASLDISMTSINKILHEHLHVKKVCSRWIPHNLTIAQKEARVDWCKKMLKKFAQGASKAVYNVCTGDESWIYSYDPETKQ